MNASQSESCFQLDVERVVTKNGPGLKTMNSGPSNKQSESETQQNRQTTALPSSSRNQQSLNVNSLCGTSDATLHFETIGQVRPAQEPSLSKSS